MSEKKKGGKRKPRRIKVSTKLALNTSRIPLSEEFLERYPLLTESVSIGADEALDWLCSSYDLPVRLLDKFGVRYEADRGRGGMNLAFPLTKRSGEIVDLFLMPVGSPERLRRVSHEHSGYELIPTYWFGLHQLQSEKHVVLVRNPLDVLNLARLGVKGVIASCCWPTKAQFLSIKPEFSYFAFERSEEGRQAIQDGVKHMLIGTKNVFLWSVVGVHNAREIESLGQFKTVYLRKHAIVSA